MTERPNSRKYARVNVTDKELAQIDEIAECLGYTNRTELYTACIHILLYGDTAEFVRQNNRKTELTRRMSVFFNILDELAFPVIALRGIAPVYTFLLDDIRRELFNRTDAVPTDETLKHWLKIYANINRTRLDEYCDEIRRQHYIEEEALA